MDVEKTFLHIFNRIYIKETIWLIYIRAIFELPMPHLQYMSDWSDIITLKWTFGPMASRNKQNCKIFFIHLSVSVYPSKHGMYFFYIQINSSQHEFSRNTEIVRLLDVACRKLVPTSLNTIYNWETTLIMPNFWPV